MQPFSDADSRPLVFSDAELERLFDRHHVNAAGRALVRKVRSSPPSRVVRPGPGHVTGAYPSPRMGFALQYESLIELSFIMECEFDRSELECFDQPDALTLRYLGKNDHPVATAHTPDFLQISDDFIGYVECKPDETLSKLARERPGRWSRDSDGTWRSIPSEQAAARYGLAYRVRSSSSFCRVLLDNLAFLQDYRSSACPPVGEDVARPIRDVVGRRIGLTLEELIHATAVAQGLGLAAWQTISGLNSAFRTARSLGTPLRSDLGPHHHDPPSYWARPRNHSPQCPLTAKRHRHRPVIETRRGQTPEGNAACRREISEGAGRPNHRDPGQRQSRRRRQ